jgi:hypothetical protein
MTDSRRTNESANNISTSQKLFRQSHDIQQMFTLLLY